MSRYNQKPVKTTPPASNHVLMSEPKASTVKRTHGGSDGHQRDIKSELFIRATSSFAGQKSFYESADKRDMRLVELTEKLAVTPQGYGWLCGFLPWLRGEGNMRTAPLLIAAEAVRARLDRNLPSPVPVQKPGVTRTGSTPVSEPAVNNCMTHRQLLDAVLQRPDEPGELLAYWLAVHGRKVPQPVKRAIADAATRMYTERSLLKYDTASHGVRFGDVLELTHAKPRRPHVLSLREGENLEEALDRDSSYAAWQSALFKYAIDRRHGHDTEIPSELATLLINRGIRRKVAEGDTSWLLDSDKLRHGGMTWEDALSLAGNTVPKDKLWEAMIPSMGYMALIRNLRNFDEAGISNKMARTVCDRIDDLEEVSKSRQLPFRFLSAYLNAPSFRWAQALEEAITHSLYNVPELAGRTLILIDTSGSMQRPVSANSKVDAVTAAALFGLALKLKNPKSADVYGWADGQFSVSPDRGMPLLKLAQEFGKMVGSVGHGTRMADAVRNTFKGHDRVIILSDMQAFPSPSRWGGMTAGMSGVSESAPSNVPMYCWNIIGYTDSAAPSGGKTNRYDLAGLTDSSFRMMKQLEDAERSTWPWETSGGV